MSHKAFRASFTLAAAGDIAPADAQPAGHLPLGEGAGGPQAVPQGDDLPFPGVQKAVDVLIQLFRLQLQVNLIQDVVLVGHDVLKGDGVSVLVGVDGVADGQVGGGLFLPAEVHQNLVFNAPAGVGGKTGALVVVEGGDGLDKADGADGDQVVLIAEGGVVFLDDVGHQAQVVLDEDAAGLLVSLPDPKEALGFLLGGEGLGEGTASGYMEGQVKEIAQGE